MTQVIQIKRSSVALKVPTTAQLVAGELALNTTDGKLYAKNAAGDGILEIGSSTFTGDATGSGSTEVALTLATVNSNVGSGYNTFSVNAKGLVTAASTTAYLTGNESITVTGDVSGTGTTALTLTLPTVNSNVGTYNNVTVNAKGQVTAGSNVSYLTGNQSITLSGDFTGSGTTAITGTLATVNSNVGSFGSSSASAVVTVNAKGLVTAVSSATITPAAIGAVATSALGANSGVATLDSAGKLTTSQVPDALTGALQYQGVWNATTNSPTLVSGTGTKGQYYKVSVAGSTTIDGQTGWSVGDLVIYDGAAWQQVQGGASDVTSVFGRVGAVTLGSSDVTTALGFTPYNATNPDAFISGNESITVSGDISGSGTTAITATLATVNSNVGTFGSATVAPVVTVNAKGLVTAVSTATITPAWSSITSTPTTLAGYGISDAMSSGMTIDGGSY